MAAIDAEIAKLRRSSPASRRNGRPSRSSSAKSAACATSSIRHRQGGTASRPDAQQPRRRRGAGDGARLANAADKEELRRQLREKFETLEGRDPEKRMIYAHVDEQVVASVVSDWTGIPVGRMVKDEIENVLRLPEILNRRVVGQSHGLAMIAKRIETNRAKLDNPNKPIGVFMLCGPSGVGKTETALALAEALYGGEQNMITINMSEFQEAHTVSSLKGAPPGYVGYGEGGRLTEAVRRRPYSVILLDEVEKAHPDVHEIFFQVFDKGFMDDGNGRRIDFKNTLIILTTNVGTDLIMGLAGRSEIPRRSRSAGSGAAARTPQGIPGGAARAHGFYSLLSALGQDARRHRAPAARPHRRGVSATITMPPSSMIRPWSIISSRCATIRIPVVA